MQFAGDAGALFGDGGAGGLFAVADEGGGALFGSFGTGATLLDGQAGNPCQGKRGRGEDVHPGPAAGFVIGDDGRGDEDGDEPGARVRGVAQVAKEERGTRATNEQAAGGDHQPAIHEGNRSGDGPDREEGDHRPPAPEQQGHDDGGGGRRRDPGAEPVRIGPAGANGGLDGGSRRQGKHGRFEPVAARKRL